MRDSGLKDTSISSYTQTLKSFLSWCNAIILIGNTITIFSSTIRLITNTEQ